LLKCATFRKLRLSWAFIILNRAGLPYSFPKRPKLGSRQFQRDLLLPQNSFFSRIWFKKHKNDLKRIHFTDFFLKEATMATLKITLLTKKTNRTCRDKLFILVLEYNIIYIQSSHKIFWSLNQSYKTNNVVF